jgi:N-acetylglucosaminyl-diphospho-decaprenol L-rhamnosyltransferase
MDMSSIDVSIVLVSWNTHDILLNCLASLHEAVGDVRADVWVVDNDSHDGSIEAVRTQYPNVRIIANTQNIGFAAANNQAITASAGRYILLLNSDTIACPGAIERLVHFADTHPVTGVVGSMLLDPDGSFQASFADFPSLFSELLSVSGLGARLLHRNYPSYGSRLSQSIRRVDYIPGACMLARRAAVEHVGLMDEQYFMYSEEVDWCLRMRRAGWETWYVPDARIVHFGGQSTRQQHHAMLFALYRSKVRFFRKHYGSLAATLLQTMLVVVLRYKWLIWILTSMRYANDDTAPVVKWRDLRSS